MKVVKPYHGTDAAMGYKYRARTESRTVWAGWFWNRRQVTQRRFVIERYFWTGTGRAIPKIVMRKGTIVHKQTVGNVPTGYLGTGDLT